MKTTARAGLALWPLLCVACGTPSAPSPEPSVSPGPRAFLLSLSTEARRDAVLRSTAIGDDGRLAESGDLPLAAIAVGPLV
jgi:hypothetical protein